MPTVRALVREPLVHFAILGALLFAVDAAVSHEPDAPACAGLTVPTGPIVVDDAVRTELAQKWGKTHPAPPDAAQLDRLVQRWIDEEVLYREGLARGLAEGDAIVHERIASQQAYVLESQIVVPEPTDDELRAMFDAEASRWAQPGRVDFTQVYVEGTDDAAQTRARELLRLLEGGADPDGLGDTFAGGRRFRGRRVAELAERFGDAFVDGIEDQPEASWALRRSSTGIHLVRIDRRSAATTPELDDVRDAVRHDWQEAWRKEALQRAEAELRNRWEIVVTP